MIYIILDTSIYNYYYFTTILDFNILSFIKFIYLSLIWEMSYNDDNLISRIYNI
jgi:hypothetical protein